jgi:hypothetical protein
MAQPEITFQSPEEQLQYSIKVLSQAGFTPVQIERIRNEAGVGKNKIPYDKETTGWRRFMVQELLAARMSNRQIAEALNLSKETVNGDRKHNREIWTQEILKSQDTWRAQLLREQAELKEMAVQGFHASKKRRTIITKEGTDESTIKIEETAGESSFLTVAKGCLEQQAKMLGLFDIKPQQEEKSGYKNFLDSLSSQIAKVKEAERTATDRATAIEAKAEFDDDGNPTGKSKPMLSAQPEDDGEGPGKEPSEE